MAKVIIHNARLSFPDLFEAKQFQGQGPFQFRSAFILDPEASRATIVYSPTEKKEGNAIKVFNKVLAEVAAEKWGAKAEGFLKAAMAAGSQKCCFYDGDTKSYNGYAGNWIVSATRNQNDGAPMVVDRNKRPLTAKDGKLYSGCYVNGTVEIWAQSNEFGKALRATLVNVQFAGDGESFGGAAPATANDLDDLGYDGDDDIDGSDNDDLG
jgi:hypothetical protein